MKRQCYIARYPLDGDDLREEIIQREPYCSPEMRVLWDSLVSVRSPGEPMLQMWYSDNNQVQCLATTNQPFRLS